METIALWLLSVVILQMVNNCLVKIVNIEFQFWPYFKIKFYKMWNFENELLYHVNYEVEYVADMEYIMLLNKNMR
jgi:hypothetical protein